MSIVSCLRVASGCGFAVALGLVSATTTWAQAGPPALFADAPATAASQRPSSDTAVRARDVAVQMDVLRSTARTTGATISLNLFADASFTTVIDRVDTVDSGFVSVGHIPDVDMSTVTLSVSGDAMYGSVFTPAAVYIVRPSSDGSYAVEQVDQSRYRPEAEPQIPAPADAATQSQADSLAAPSADVPPSAQPDDGSIIDVMVLYTPAAAAEAGGTSAMLALVNASIATTNASYANSAVIQRLRLVYTSSVAYTESGNIITDLNNITNGSGAFSGVAALRNTVRADLVALLTDTPASSFCGVAWHMATVSTAFAPSGYSVTEQSCAVGNLSFPHELGHNMGLRHDWFVDAGTTPFSYAHGYVRDTPDGSGARWRTIMAYNDRCSSQGLNCTRLPYWSNSSILRSGVAMGVTGGTSSACTAGSLVGTCDADDERALNETAYTVARFRQRARYLTLDFGPGVGLFQYTEVSGPSWRGLHPASPTVVATTDLDSNGVSDTIATFAGAGVWAHMNSSTWVPLNPNDATLIRSGDVNGNGRTDLLLVFPFGAWLRYDNGSWVNLHAGVVNAAAIGNMDLGAGKDEVVLSIPGAGIWVYQNDASWFLMHPSAAAALLVGDLGGNQQADFIIHFAGAGVWTFRNGTTWVNLTPLNPIGMTVGNFNGDAARRSDVFLNLPGAGVWLYRDDVAWFSIHPANPVSMSLTDVNGDGADDAAFAFGGAGTWLYKFSGGWSGLSPQIAEAIAGEEE